MTKSVAAAPLTHRYNPTLVNLDDKFVFILGSINPIIGHHGGTSRKKSTTDFYDVSRDAWTKGPMMKAIIYPHISACILDGILYAFKGAMTIESLNARSLVNGQFEKWQRVELKRVGNHCHLNPYFTPINDN